MTWRPVYGFEGIYEVSDAGKVRSIDRIDPAGRSLKGKELVPRRTGGDRWAVCLYKDRKRYQIQVHVLVLEAFVGPRPEGSFGLHWDDDHDNNNLANLRWGSRSENSYDSVRNGKHKIALRTHCPRGHLLGGKNNRRHEESLGRRCCLACDRVYGRLYHKGAEKPYDHPDFQRLSDQVYKELTGGSN